MKKNYRFRDRYILFFSIWVMFAVILFARGKQEYSPSDTTRVIFLGTGTPNPDPLHSGNSLAIVVNDTPYIVDFGAGFIRKAAALSPRYGGSIEGLTISNIKHAFCTHLHSDHTLGYPDLILTPWVMGREEPLQVYGPEGIRSMTDHILKAYEEDIKMRLYGLEPANNKGWRVDVSEIKEGIVYKDKNVTVEAFLVEHGSWPEAFGYKFTTPDKTIAISGDTIPCDNLIKKCQGVDILIHEVYSAVKLQTCPLFWQKYHPRFHTSTVELAEIAKKVKPGLLILYHQLYWGCTDQQLVKEITDRYKGRVVSARDLDIF